MYFKLKESASRKLNKVLQTTSIKINIIAGKKNEEKMNKHIAKQ